MIRHDRISYGGHCHFCQGLMGINIEIDKHVFQNWLPENPNHINTYLKLFSFITIRSFQGTKGILISLRFYCKHESLLSSVMQYKLYLIFLFCLKCSKLWKLSSQQSGLNYYFLSLSTKISLCFQCLASKIKESWVQEWRTKFQV
jgi:hypothetical protein